MIVALIHIDGANWGAGWAKTRAIADICDDKGIRIETKVLGYGAAIRIQTKKYHEEFSSIVDEVLNNG